MKRFGIVALLLGAVVAPPAAADAGAPLPPRAQLRDLVCQRALDPAARAMDVTAVMRPVAGTEHMALSFQLLAKPEGGTAFAPVTAAPGLGTWLTPKDPTLGQRPGDKFVAYHPVADLTAPAAYRYEASFRWTGTGGRVLATVNRFSRACQQPELRPDLQVQSIAVSGHQYSVVIANTGATAAGPFDVRFLDGAVTKDKTVPRIGPHGTRTVQFYGPRCDVSAPPTVTADPNDQVDVYSRTQATVAATCSAPQTS